ncbi:FAD/NAD(P)-binding protein [Amaricoccus sp.]|uniref:FAD/NAD(P)-binding protein n=1 Tax=Amaricoccus sp. TaxID=1872485 RepID=UPI001B48D32C|nr:FAD/NAD(P)-binding protein [Amaricoccus sp.]MBP7002383.1 FAD/NAD(P)-binding protein [Amaricoccus sp.]
MTCRHVIVVGGGAAGALAALHLLRVRADGFWVTMVDPAGRLGRGVAYGTDSPSHLLNARARSMSAFEDQPGHFTDWLAAAGLGHDPDRYAERRLYGRYLEEALRPYAAGGGDGRLAHIRGVAREIVETGHGVRVELADGAAILGQAAILAVGHGLRPELPRPATAPAEGDVLILGTGLGMVDAALDLLDAGHPGPIVALSRRGLAPQPHGPRVAMRLEPADIPLGTHLTWLMRWLRAETRALALTGAAWGDVVDALRPHVPAIWASLPLDARRRFLRHARPWWDAHRHRMAPEVARRIAAARAEGRLRVLAGRVVERRDGPDGAAVTWRARGSGELHSRRFAAVIDCTGPRSGPVAADPLVASLVAAGAARPDPLGLGLEVTPDLAPLRPSRASPSGRLLAVGPLTAPLAWETYAIPEIRAQCARAARLLAEAIDPGIALPAGRVEVRRWSALD